MGTAIKPTQIYQRALQAFKKLDAQDGVEDQSASLAKAGKEYKTADFDQDKKINFGEFLAFELRRDALLNTLVGNFTFLAKKAGWSDSQVANFLKTIFEGAGDKVGIYLNEVLSYLVYDQNRGIQTLQLIAQLGIELENGQVISLLDATLQKKGIPAEKIAALEETIYVINAYIACFGTEANLSSALNRLHNWLSELPVGELTSAQEHRLLWHLLQKQGKKISGGDLAAWVKVIKAVPVLTPVQIELVLDALSTPLLAYPDDLPKLIQLIKTIPEWQLAIVGQVLNQGKFSSLAKVEQFCAGLAPIDGQSAVGLVNYDSSWPSLEEGKIFLILLSHLKQPGRAGAKAALEYIGQLNRQDVTREEGYSGKTATLEGLVRWRLVLEKVAAGLGIELYQLEERLSAAWLAEVPADTASLAEIKTALKKVPTQGLFAVILSSETGFNKISNWLDKYWQDIRPLLGHIFLKDTKIEYYQALTANLEKQGMAFDTPVEPKKFVATIIFYDLKEGEIDERVAEFTPLGNGLLLIRVQINPDTGEEIAGIVNPQDPRDMQAIMRQVSARLNYQGVPEEQYAVVYYPKITFSADGRMTVNLDYQSGRVPENLLAKIPKAEPSQPLKGQELQPAVKLFNQLFSQEPVTLAEELQYWQSLQPDILSIALGEVPMSVSDLTTVIEIMGSVGAPTAAIDLFGISQQEYEQYATRIETILCEASQQKLGLQPEELLLKATEACDGRIQLAALVTYNVLWQYKLVMFKRFPGAFAASGSTDPAAAIYHFFGCFFAAYSFQFGLVDRYKTDKVFQAEIDQAVTDFTRDYMKFDAKQKALVFTFPSQNGPVEIKLDFANQQLVFPPNLPVGKANYYLMRILLFLQFRLLQEGGGNFKEIISLAGVFYEQIIEDKGDTEDLPGNFRGMAAAHALFQLVHGQELTRFDEQRQLLVKALGQYVGADKLSAGEMFRLGSLIAPQFFSFFGVLGLTGK